MAREYFSNNAVSALAVGIDDEEEYIELNHETADLFMSQGEGDGWFQRLTITNDEIPDEYEIVIAEGWSYQNSDLLKVTRGVEDTSPRSWPQGSTVSARVTAGMLREMGGKLVPNNDDRSQDYSTSSGRLVINSFVHDVYAPSLLIGGVPVVPQQFNLQPWDGADDFEVSAFSRDAIGATPYYEIGDAAPDTWTQNESYGHWGIVKSPPAAGGEYYVLDLNPGVDWHTSRTEPNWGADRDEAVDNDNHEGYWYKIPAPDGFAVQALMPNATCAFVVTEVGFICHEYGASSPPKISAGTDEDGTLFANGVTASTITASGTIFRVPVNDGAIVPPGGSLVFAVHTPAASGTCKGRFYWRGFFLEGQIPVV